MNIHFDPISWMYPITEVVSLLYTNQERTLDLDGNAKLEDWP